MDVRIGVIQTPRELSVELPDDTDREQLKARISEVLADDTQVLWLVDRRGREVAVAASRIAFVEVGALDGERKMGFGGLNVDLLARRLLFVTGKGGVGKTTVAAALGLLAAREGRRTLVCEVDAKGALADALEAGPTSFRPTEVRTGLWAMAMDTEESLKEYLSLQLHLPLVARIGSLARTLDFVATAAPGVNEILTVGKLCYEVRADHYDLVVVDASATGHIVGQLAAPDAINSLVQLGMVRDQTRWMLDILEDPASTGVVMVTSPEEMPVNETIELAARLRGATRVDVAAVVVNRVLPELFGRREEEIFDRLRTEPLLGTLRHEVGPGVDAVLDAAELAVRLRRAGAEHLDTLRRALGDRLPMLYVPELFHRTPGRRATAQIAEALGEELGV